MNLKPRSKNATELVLNKYRILYSYSTPVVAINRETKKVMVTNQFYSSTTSKHINAYLKETSTENYETVDQIVLDKLAGEVK
jgi:hypothetical protein